MELPGVEGGFRTILVDPPWAFKTYGGKNQTPHRGAHDHYKTMPIGELMALPVKDIAAKDAALFMWVVDSHFPDAIALAQAWGFSFKTCAFVWVKDREGVRPQPGMGYWTRKQQEQLWLFTRGRPKRLDKGVNQLIFCPRGEHSAKPEQQYGLIERLTEGPRLELFARTTRPGWTVWGNETGKRDGSLL